MDCLAEVVTSSPLGRNSPEMLRNRWLLVSGPSSSSLCGSTSSMDNEELVDEVDTLLPFDSVLPFRSLVYKSWDS
eukprot:747468-Hanusia_phi.AAC.4